MTTGVRHWLIALMVAVSLHAVLLLLRLPATFSGAEPASGGGIEIDLALMQRAAQEPASSPAPESVEQPPQPKPMPEPAEQTPQPKPAAEPEPEPVSRPAPEPTQRPAAPVASTPGTRSVESLAPTPPKPAEAARQPTIAKAASPRQAEPVQVSKPKPAQQAVAAQANPNPPIRSQASAEAATRSGPQGESETANKAEQTGAGSSSGMAKDYLMRVLAYLDRFKEYPYQARMSRQEGIAHLRFTIDRSGRILSYQLERSTRFPLLDQQALRMLEKANPLPPMPEDMQRSRMEVVLPVAFNLR